jgi:four helix bundle protein
MEPLSLPLPTFTLHSHSHSPDTTSPSPQSPPPSFADAENRTQLRSTKSEIRNKSKIILIRSSGSVGANYIEANEALSKKDFLMRIKISRKEAKESAYWLRLMDTDDAPELVAIREALLAEAIELMKIFGSILRKSE